uniref:ABC transporter domain-containing protein n=1 Tax=Plectus sambesii TaxID=2011161 RepID=A0A914UYS3_9BILA
MDEADTLGDQVILMAQGKIIDIGSSRELKQKYGEVLNLHIAVRDSCLDQQKSTIIETIARFAEKYCIVKCDEKTLHIQLETYQISWDSLAEICFHLDQSRTDLHISRLSVNITSLDDAFQQHVKPSQDDVQHAPRMDALIERLRVVDQINGMALFCQQFQAMVAKKFFLSVRRVLMLMTQIAVPLVVIGLGLGLIPTCGTAALTAMSFENQQSQLRAIERDISEILTTFIPQFAFSKTVMQYYTNRLMEDQCERMNRSCTGVGSDSLMKITHNYLEYSYPGVGRFLCCLAIQGATLFLLLALLEANIWLKIKLLFSPSKDIVQRARPNISRPLIAVENLTIRLGKQTYSKPVVDEMSFEVRPGECACIVGANGAGKTSLLRSLCGQLPLKAGMARIADYDVISNRSKALKQIGFCPQFDALPEFLTVMQCLGMFAQIRGIPRKKIQPAVEAAVILLKLERHAFKQIRHLR